MAESTDNVVMYGMRGLVGKLLVFKNFFGKTIVARRPRRTDAPPLPEQLERQERFRLAAIYAKNAIAVPLTKAEYEAAAKPGQTAFNIALADFFKAPEVSNPDVSAYTGAANQKLRVRAVDNFKVASVTVSIEQADGTPVESGNAVMTADGINWEYTTKSVNAVLAGSKVLFTATDLPGNSTTLEIILP